MPASDPQRVQVRLPVPKLWRALRRARRPRSQRSRMLLWLRIAAVALTVGLQTLFVLELLKPSPPLPLLPEQEEELELILDDILAASDDGGLDMVRPQLGSGRRDIARAPLAEPTSQTRAAAPRLAAPLPAPQTAVRVLQPEAGAVPRAVPDAAPPAAPAPVATVQLSRPDAPQPPQLALPSTTPPEQVRPRVLEVDQTTPREWAQAPMTLPQASKEAPPPELAEPPPVLPTLVLAPDRPSLQAAPPAQVIEPRSAPRPPQLAPAPQLPPARIPLSNTEPTAIARSAPTAIQLQAEVPQVELAANSRALEVQVRPVLTQAAPAAIELDTALPPIEVSAVPVLPPTPQVTRAPIPRAAPISPQTTQLTEVAPVSTDIAPVNQNLLTPQRQVEVTRVLPSNPVERPRMAVQAPQLQVDNSGLPDPASLRALQPQARDLRELARASAAVAPTTIAPDSPRPALPGIELATGPVDSAADGSPSDADSPLPPAGARGPGTTSEFDGPGLPGAPASNAAELLSGIGAVARDQVQQSVPPPADRRGSFLDRRYDPFYEDLPDRLRLIEENNPGGLRQVLGFLAKSLQGGGVTLRDGKLEAGAEALNRPVPTEAELEAALGMLLDRWLELHDGDVRRACAQSNADMSEVVRELLCSAPESLPR